MAIANRCDNLKQNKMDSDKIYKKVMDYNLEKYTITNGKLKAVNFKYALIDGIITDEDYNYYFEND